MYVDKNLVCFLQNGGQIIDLTRAEVEEGELSEADKIINAQLLEEAQKASNSSKQRLRRSRKGSASSGESNKYHYPV